jgi:hypothetical protein
MPAKYGLFFGFFQQAAGVDIVFGAKWPGDDNPRQAGQEFGDPHPESAVNRSLTAHPKAQVTVGFRDVRRQGVTAFFPCPGYLIRRYGRIWGGSVRDMTGQHDRLSMVDCPNLRETGFFHGIGG